MARPVCVQRRRVLKTAFGLAVAAILVVGAVLLFPTAVPGDLRTPAVNVDATFGAQLVSDARRYERFFYLDWFLAQVALVVTLWLYARRGAAFTKESSAGPIGTGMLLGMLGLGIAWLVGMPFRIAAHWWERRNDQSDLGYLDWIVGDWALLAAEFLSICLALVIVMGLARWLGERWWLPGAAVFVAIAGLFNFVAPYLDYTTDPLRDKALLADARDYERELGLSTIPIRVEVVSRDTDQANAYAYGLGPSRRVVLWDTILAEPFTPGEQRVVLAHELAHHSQTHLLEGIGWFALFAVPGAWILMRTTRRRGGMGVPEAIPLALLVVVVFQLATTPLANAISRRMEAEADWKALQVTKDPPSLEGLMIEFSKTSLGDPDPPRWAQLMLGTYPSLADRIAMAREWTTQAAPP